jgi:hypothetical protein
MPKSAAVKATHEIEREVSLIQSELMSFPFEHREFYGDWLAQTYYYVRRVSHVLAAAASRTPIERSALHDHFLRGITEEKDHAVLALEDLKDLGVGIERFPEHPLTKAYYQTLFHMIEHAGPESVLGYFFVLEGVAGTDGRKLYERVDREYRGKAQAFLKEHIMLDADHYPRALRLLETLDDAQLAVVSESTTLAGPLYRYMVATVHAERRAGDQKGARH